jgi:hypothetical protein
MIDYIYMVALDQVVLLCFPIILIFFWIFNDETGIGEDFSI